MELNIAVKPRPNGIYYISVRGDVGKYTAEYFNSRIDDIVRNPIKFYVMDLSEVAYIDFIGIESIAYSIKKAKEIQGDIKFWGLSPMVKDFFEITRLTRVLEIYDSEEDALNSYRLALGK